ncbi:uncharacterized protein N7498_009205 [Penicillium cinerascens]|uniref:HPP transmembrane region domain-containing protein n=1 Tax=Penicillium cinerascens TaxID=70096 RepID=A0A9W9J4H5_9EURO|nr:uncharacterized protein N7498_009205 [Penicillium cinerascens]KAJ5190220.1 hypothetical protein N7498_009205 [Penicillium cinerascens]
MAICLDWGIRGDLLIEAIMSTNTAFRDVYHSPLIITSFGASAVLLFGVIESPVAQPRNFLGGHFLSALVGTCITRLFVLNRQYQGYLDNTNFHPSTFINGGISMATSLLVMLITKTAHPPAGATGLNAAVESAVVTLSWRYLPVIIASSLIMFGWALLINNLGRRRYLLHWWAAGQTFVREPEDVHDEEALEQVEEGEIERELTEEGDLAAESDDTRSRLSEVRSRLSEARSRDSETHSRHSEPKSGPAENTGASKGGTHTE